jgi:hypothetical protein
MAMNEAAYDLIAAKLAEAKRAHTAELNRQLFASVELGMRPMPPKSWSEPIRWKLRRVGFYFSTLWKALRGVDLEEPRDDY